MKWIGRIRNESGDILQECEPTIADGIVHCRFPGMYSAGTYTLGVETLDGAPLSGEWVFDGLSLPPIDNLKKMARARASRPA